MPYFDRHWGWRWLGAALTGISAVVLPLRFLQIVLPEDQRSNTNPQADWLFALGMVIALAATAFWLARGARLARERVEWRMDVLDGREDAPHTGEGSRGRPGAEPIFLVERITRFDRVNGCFWLVMTVVGGIPIVIFVLIAFVSAYITPGHAAFHLFHLSLAMFTFFAATMFFGMLLIGYQARDAISRSPRIVADDMNITWTSRWGRTQQMRWEDARLFEISFRKEPDGRSITRFRRYTLFSRDAAIRWDDRVGNYRTIVPFLDIVERRTGLEPCALDQRSENKVLRWIQDRDRRSWYGQPYTQISRSLPPEHSNMRRN
ncbi:MAG: hypothetical protein OJF49_004461 [Ktedonobacterales bacterium]|nr:MAG: hypothetical protein OJF49_004461 [Ktedonobacterales bacterium]